MNEMERHESLEQPQDWFTAESLRALKQQLAEKPYPGYPDERLHYGNGASWDETPILPEGPWSIHYDIPVPDPETHIYQTDDKGRPTHPWLNAMLSDPEIGVVTGKGFYWSWGPNYTADPIVTRKTDTGTEILLIQRGDTGKWALPGGFINEGEDPLCAAAREAGEETGLDVSPLIPTARPVYDGPLADLRVTANAWPHTYAFHFDATGLVLPDPVGGDDARDAAWVPIDQLPGVLFGSHSLLIAKALE